MQISFVTRVDANDPIKVTGTLASRMSQENILRLLATVVSPYFSDVIVDRFAWGGDKAVGGPWPPLAAYTERLKRSMGFPSNAPNERTGDMLQHLAYDHRVDPHPLGGTLTIPDGSDAVMREKIRVAQEGESSEENAFGGATPPRPVLAIGAEDELAVERIFDAYLWAGMT